MRIIEERKLQCPAFSNAQVLHDLAAARLPRVGVPEHISACAREVDGSERAPVHLQGPASRAPETGRDDEAGGPLRDPRAPPTELCRPAAGRGRGAGLGPSAPARRPRGGALHWRRRLRRARLAAPGAALAARAQAAPLAALPRGGERGASRFATRGGGGARRGVCESAGTRATSGWAGLWSDEARPAGGFRRASKTIECRFESGEQCIWLVGTATNPPQFNQISKPRPGLIQQPRIIVRTV